jgi:hypothetical protein
MLAPAGINHRFRDPIQHNVSIQTILYVGPRDDEDRGVELRHWDLPGPSQIHDFLFPKPRIHLEERHLGEVTIEFRK